MGRAQTAAEFVALVALIFVLVASMMLTSFRQQEVTLALSSARLGCISFTSQNSTYVCTEIRYFYMGTQNVTIVPLTVPTLTDTAGKTILTRNMLEKMASVFRPPPSVSGSCYTAAYYTYCIAYP